MLICMMLKSIIFEDTDDILLYIRKEMVHKMLECQKFGLRFRYIETIARKWIY